MRILWNEKVEKEIDYLAPKVLDAMGKMEKCGQRPKYLILNGKKFPEILRLTYYSLLHEKVAELFGMEILIFPFPQDCFEFAIYDTSWWKEAGLVKEMEKTKHYMDTYFGEDQKGES